MSDNTAAFAALDAQIQRLRQVSAATPEIAREVADEFRRILVSNIKAGRGPEGQPWPPRKADGGRALVNADKALEVEAIKNAVVATLTGPIAKHDLGVARGRVRRPILPTRKLPGPVVIAIKRVVDRRLKETIDGR